MNNPRYVTCALLTMALFAIVTLKDFSIFLYFLFYGSAKKGFTDAVWVHMVTLPVDSLVILVISIWASIILAKDSTRECR